MTCPHLEETSALFDGAAIDRTHADSCDECRAFLADAAALREAMREVTYAAPRRRLAPILLPAAFVVCLVLLVFLWPRKSEDGGPFAGLDGGGRAVITVKDTR